MIEVLHWDPLPHEREFYRSKTIGDRAYRVIREGKEVMRLDRPMQEIVFPKTDDWIADEFGSLLLPAQASMVAFAADRAACKAVGLHEESRVGWQDLTDKKRIEFMHQGPGETAHPMRRGIYEAIRVAMKAYVR